MNAQQHLISLINNTATPIDADYSNLLDNIGNARFVLIGEASHGTQEFYQTRIEITQQLIEKKGFMAIVIEGDWPDAHRIHRFIQGRSNDTPFSALDDFQRFPQWMWRNITMPPFLEWLYKYNNQLTPREKIGFYGLDLYSLNSSMHAVVNYLMKVDPPAAEEAKRHYACFDHMNEDPQMYAYLANANLKKSCIKEVMEALYEVQQQAFKYTHNKNINECDDYFFAEQNARVVKDAETYYRSMFEGQVISWNIRDKHMMDTVQVLAEHLERRFNKPAKLIIWAHNSHIGDARATEMGERGEYNIGQLTRQQYYSETYSIGFSTYEGFVTAASDWDEPAQYKKIVPGLKGSYEELFHQVRYKKFILNLNHTGELEHFLKIPRLQRAIGVIYRPETERISHYFFTRLPYQFDSIIHYDCTNALKAID